MQRVVTYLTIALVIVGALLLAHNHIFSTDLSYSSADAYGAAKAAGDLPETLPDLPACASAIAVSKRFGTVRSVTFTCTDKTERDAFMKEIKKGFDWNILIFEGGRVELDRSNAQ